MAARVRPPGTDGARLPLTPTLSPYGGEGALGRYAVTQPFTVRPPSPP